MENIFYIPVSVFFHFLSNLLNLKLFFQKVVYKTSELLCNKFQDNWSTNVYYTYITAAINAYILRREANCVMDIFYIQMTIQHTSSYKILPRCFIMSLAMLGLRPYIKNYRPDPETNIMSNET